jgi:glycosyltransferase involved in cell wall biosynthesis
MTTADLTLVVTVHSETLVAGPTMASADLAVAAARAAGYTVQTVIALDNATPATTEYFAQADFDHWERWVMQEGDLGRVRNALAPRTDGRYIAYLDADDMYSENWLAKGLAVADAAREHGEQVIAHPEVIITFDGAVGMHQNVDQSSPLFTPYFLYVRNCYDSLCLTPREAHLTVPYVHRDIPNGLSWQDWQFAIETMSRGWRHVLVTDTIIFKRRRDFSLMVESAGRRALVRSLPEMAIDRVRDLTRPGKPDDGDSVAQ